MAKKSATITTVAGQMQTGGEDRFAALPTVTAMGTKIFDPIWKRAHTPRNCELMHVLRGRVNVVVAGARCAAGPGDTLLVPAGVPHRDDFDIAQELEVFLLYFQWAPHREFFARVPPRLIQSLPASRKVEISRIVERLRDGHVGHVGLDQFVAATRLHTILALLLREAEQGAPREMESPGRCRRCALMLEAKTFLQQHYSEPISLEQIARALGVSAFHLSHVFSEESDFTLFDYLTRLRMEKARELLTDGRLKISAAARAVGYENSNYFAKAFRRYFGFLPSEVTSRNQVS